MKCGDCGHEMFLVEDHGDPLCDVYYCEICDAFEEVNCEPFDDPPDISMDGLPLDEAAKCDVPAVTPSSTKP